MAQFRQDLPRTACAIYLRKKPVGRSLALRWKLSTAIQKRFILLQDRFGWYEYQDWIRENEEEFQQQSAGLKMHAEGLAYRPRVSLLIPWKSFYGRPEWSVKDPCRPVV